MKQHRQTEVAIAYGGRNAIAKPTLTYPGKPPDKEMVWIPGGTFTMGSDDHYLEEAPTQRVTVTGFWMDKYAVTNKQFQRFVKATQYVTVAERSPNLEDYPGALPELLVPGSLVFQQPLYPVDLDSCSWWNYIPGANWRHPEGPGSSIKGRENYPVVHIAYEDAETYAKWAGKALPTEAQWEFAARGGLEGAVYVWGNEFLNNKLLVNVWQGEFPWQNLKSHSPRPESVGSYAPNNYGLYEITGNVWEWTMDWYRSPMVEGSPSPPLRSKPKSCCIPVNPRGGTLEESFDPNFTQIRIPRKVLKGGSFLCATSYCFRYRPAARHPETIDTSTCHIGFRCVSSN